MPKRFASPPAANPSAMSPAMWSDSNKIESRDVTVSMTLDFISHSPVGSLLRIGAYIGYAYEKGLFVVSECRPRKPIGLGMSISPNLVRRLVKADYAFQKP